MEKSIPLQVTTMVYAPPQP